MPTYGYESAQWWALMAIGTGKANAGPGVPASIVLVQYQTKKCRTVLGHSGTGLVPVALVFSFRYWTD
jgi:hypothetical protein